MKNSIQDAVVAIRRGRVVGVPTDTVYGLAVDPWHESAVRRLYEIKGRPERKPIGLLAASPTQAAEVVDLRPATELLRHWPGALTLVVHPKTIIPDWLGDRAVNTVGIRVPDHPLLIEFLTITGPLAVTSANRSGGPEVLDDIGARELFGDEVEVYLPGRCPGGVASTVVDATGSPPRLLRSGPVVVD